MLVCFRIDLHQQAFTCTHIVVRVLVWMWCVVRQMFGTIKMQHCASTSAAIVECWMMFIVLFSSIRVVYCYELSSKWCYLSDCIYTAQWRHVWCAMHVDTLSAKQFDAAYSFAGQVIVEQHWAHFIQWFTSHPIYISYYII